MRQTAFRGGGGGGFVTWKKIKTHSMDLGPCVIRCRPIGDIRTSLEVTRGLLECLFNCSYNEGNISCSEDNA